MKINGKKILALCISLILLVSIMAGCGSSSSTGAATTAAAAGTAVESTSAATQPAASTEVIKLKWAHHNSTTSYAHTYGNAPVAKAIEDASNGKIKIEMYPAQTLTKSTENYDAVISGITDIGWSFIAYYPNRFPLAEVINLPLMGFKTAAEASETAWKLWSETDLWKDQFKDVHVLSFMSHDPAGISTNFEVKSMDDLKGKKFRTASGPILQFYESLGASIVSMPITDCYQALEKGVIDGLSLAWEGQDNISAQEVVKHGYDVKVGAGIFYLVMNKSKWDALPDDVKAVFDQETGLKAALQFAKGWD
ncbi:MAG: TRAP transporter substrate-binding protein, partial [Clostridiales bacterium]|nr:TRAP transporter substrate-binding protein [Clostridiales bacterium]